MNNLMAFLTSMVLMTVPLDMDMKTVVNNPRCSVEATCKVTKVGDNYVYLYNIKNNSKNNVKVSWSILNRALNLGQDIEMIWDLDSEENISFVVEHPSPPLPIGSNIKVQSLAGKKELDKLVNGTPKNIKIDMPKSKYYQVDSAYTGAALPQAFIQGR